MTHEVHLIGGLAGCRYGVSIGAAVVVVDALRASATAAMLCAAGAEDILCVSSVEAALAAKAKRAGMLAFGERGAVRPAGFDYGNSPVAARHAAGRSVAFTTTNGTACLLASWGAPAVVFGTTVNAAGVARHVAKLDKPVVIVAACHVTEPEKPSPEDWAAAALIAECLGGVSGEGGAVYAEWIERIAHEGIAQIFEDAPHAETLRSTGQGEEVVFCAQVDITGAVPVAVSRVGEGVLVACAEEAHG